ncbi:hypothetical protein [Methylomagnum sp.]
MLVVFPTIFLSFCHDCDNAAIPATFGIAPWLHKKSIIFNEMHCLALRVGRDCGQSDIPISGTKRENRAAYFLLA